MVIEKQCPRCNGTGVIYFVFDRIDRKKPSVECTREAYMCLADDEDEAEERGLRWVQQDEATCPDCHGEGVIYELNEKEYDEDER